MTTAEKISMREEKKCPDKRVYARVHPPYNYIFFFFFPFAVLRPSISMTLGDYRDRAIIL